MSGLHELAGQPDAFAPGFYLDDLGRRWERSADGIWYRLTPVGERWRTTRGQPRNPTPLGEEVDEPAPEPLQPTGFEAQSDGGLEGSVTRLRNHLESLVRDIATTQRTLDSALEEQTRRSRRTLPLDDLPYRCSRHGQRTADRYSIEEDGEEAIFDPREGFCPDESLYPSTRTAGGAPR